MDVEVTGAAESRGADTAAPIVVFRAGRALLAFESRYAECFAELPEEVPLPLAPAHIRGVSLINGRVVPLLDLARFLEVDDATPRADRGDQRVIVISDGGMTVGIVAEEIGFLGSNTQVAPPEALVAGRLRDFAVGQIEHSRGLIALVGLTAVLDAARVRV